MSRVTVYSTASCPICEKTKHCLEKWQIEYEEIMIDASHDAMRKFVEVTNNARSVPQIVVDGNVIGGFSELTELHMDGDLDDLMESN